MAEWFNNNAAAITARCGAICTFAIYSILHAENKFYRFFEHVLIGIAAGYGIYVIWWQILLPMWWQPMVAAGHWYYALYLVPGSMFYFIYSKKYAWVSRVVFGLFMGLAAGGLFRGFYGIYFPQMGASMKPLVGAGMSVWDTLNVLVFYVILFCAMFYFFFSFEHKHPGIRRTAAAGRWFLMIGFGAIFGATVMGRMTLFIGRLNFLLNDWGPHLQQEWSSSAFRIGVAIVAAAAVAMIVRYLTLRSHSGADG